MNTVTDSACIQAYAATPPAGESALQYPALDCQILPATLTCLVGPHRLQLRDYLQMLAGISIANQGKVEIFEQLTSDLDKLSMRKLRSQIGYLSGTAPLLSVQHGLMQARHATSRNSGTPVTLIRSPTQRMGDALNALRP